MAKPLQAYKVQGVPAEFWNISNATIVTRTLGAGSAETFTIAAGRAVIIISDADLWINFSATAAVPTDDSSVNILVPGGLPFPFFSDDQATFSGLSAGACHVTTLTWPNPSNS